MLGFERAFVECVTRKQSLWLIFDLIWRNIVYSTFIILSYLLSYMHKMQNFNICFTHTFIAVPLGF